eukprot:6067280-Ditylum_brightwellii.AAC.1
MMNRMVHWRAMVNDCSAKEEIVHKHPSLYPEQCGQPLKVLVVSRKAEQVDKSSKNLDIKIDTNPTLTLEHAKHNKENTKGDKMSAISGNCLNRARGGYICLRLIDTRMLSMMFIGVVTGSPATKL